MLEEYFNEDNSSLRDKIIKFLKLDILFSGVQLQLKYNKKRFLELESKVASYKNEIDKMRKELNEHKDMIKSSSLVGADIRRHGKSWGVVCFNNQKEEPYVSFFEISNNKTVQEIRSILSYIQPEKKQYDSGLSYRL